MIVAIFIELRGRGIQGDVDVLTRLILCFFDGHQKV
jgi:hypothetical protein